MKQDHQALHLPRSALEAGLPDIRRSPRDSGELAMIVRRPAVGERGVMTSGTLSPEEGLVGDNWKSRGSRMTADGSAHPDMQLNIMNARAAALIAQERGRWPLAGDQLYVDLDLSLDNLPPGARLRVGDALIEVTALPHRGCKKFVERFGLDAMQFVNSEIGCRLNLRGINAKVVEAGDIRVGNKVTVESRANA